MDSSVHNTYESLPSSLPGRNPLNSPPELQYDYADATVIKARVKDSKTPPKPEEVLLVTTGFDVYEVVGEKEMEEDADMEDKPSYEGASSTQQGPAAESMSENPLYGSN